MSADYICHLWLQWFDANWVKDSDQAADGLERLLVKDLLKKRQEQRWDDYEEMLKHEEYLDFYEDF